MAEKNSIENISNKFSDSHQFCFQKKTLRDDVSYDLSAYSVSSGINYLKNLLKIPSETTEDFLFQAIRRYLFSNS